MDMREHTPDILTRINQWLSEKGYLPGHRTGELLKEAAAEITRLRARVAELEKIEAEAKAAGLIGPDGRVRKVLGTLPIAADGFILGRKADVWERNGDTPWKPPYADLSIRPLCDLYSTREAAEAARAAKEGGASC